MEDQKVRQKHAAHKEKTVCNYGKRRQVGSKMYILRIVSTFYWLCICGIQVSCGGEGQACTCIQKIRPLQTKDELKASEKSTYLFHRVSFLHCSERCLSSFQAKRNLQFIPGCFSFPTPQHQGTVFSISLQFRLLWLKEKESRRCGLAF